VTPAAAEAITASPRTTGTRSPRWLTAVSWPGRRIQARATAAEAAPETRTSSTPIIEGPALAARPLEPRRPPGVLGGGTRRGLGVCTGARAPPGSPPRET